MSNSGKITFLSLLPYVIVSAVSIIITVVFMVLVFGVGGRSVSLRGDLSSFGLSSTQPQSYVVKIGDFYLSTDSFDEEYRILVYNSTISEPEKRDLLLNDVTQKKMYFENLISEYVILLNAYNEGFLNSKDWDVLSKISLRKAIVESFLNKKIDISSIQVSAKEVEKFYQENKEYFRKNNIPPDQAEELIKRQLISQKYKIAVSELLNKYRDKLIIDRKDENIK